MSNLNKFDNLKVINFPSIPSPPGTRQQAEEEEACIARGTRDHKTLDT